MRDAEWIATLPRAGFLNASFIPEKSFRELRHLTRYRKSIVHDITSQKNHIEKFLQSSGFRLSSFVSDIFGVTGREIILHLIRHGSIEWDALKQCLKSKTQEHLDEILAALKSAQVKRLITIPGISATASLSIITEIGTDMDYFKTAEHICSWAGLSSSTNESAGKRKSTSVVTKGNPYVKSILCEVTWVIAGKRNSHLSAWY